MSSDRYNLYREVHKGIRSLLLRLVEASGRTDYADAAAVLALTRVVNEALELLESHAEHEDRFLAPLIRAADPEVARALDAEHGEQAERGAQLREQLAHVAGAGASAPALGHAFCVAVSRFVGELMTHMADEEERALPALWAALSDDTLRQVQAALVASVPQQQKARVFAWMLPAINGPERLALVAGVRASAPAPAFEGLMAVARAALSAQELAALERGLAAVAPQAA